MKISSKISHASARLVYLTMAAVGAWMLLVTGSAQAATVTLGSPLTASFAPNRCISASCTLAFLSLPEPGAMIVSPTNGAVVRWRMEDGSSAFKYKLRVLTPGAEVKYTGSGSSAAVSPAGAGIETFPTALPIKAGQVIGIDLEKNAPLGEAHTGAGYLFWEPPIADGSAAAGTEFSGATELGFNADVLPPPTIAAISPSSGSIAGGGSVVITGANLAEVKGVSFGSVPAAGFTVNSETQITAIAPPGTTPGTVDTSVTTVAGATSASPADQFTYTACVVPKLKGKKLKGVKKKLKKADCKLGKVKGKKSKAAKVAKQSPKPGKVLAPGAKVSVKIK